MSLWAGIAQQVSAETGRRFEMAGYESAGGGCINRTAVLHGKDGRDYFVKLNQATRLPMFEAEAEGLRELGRAGALRVPEPVCTGITDEQAFLVLERLKLGRATTATDEALGHQLANLHRMTRPRFGWHRDNTIGSTPQPNPWCDDWTEFYRERRLRFQLGLATTNAAKSMQALGTRLLEQLPVLFSGHRPAASLLHGDLWGGNTAAARTGEPVIFDPAVYFGDREADLAMTELFGGFSPHFYSAYREAWPLDAGYSVRKTVYNLYHVLNHYHLFGGGYGAQAERMMQQLLSETR